MEYLITFLEGLISFISPCMLPLLPVYISYFAGEVNKKSRVIPRVLAFVMGFTAVFCILGVFAGTLGAFLIKYQVGVNVISGGIVILLGLNFLEVIHIPFFGGDHKDSHEVNGIFSAFIFGVIFSISHTPCVGAFLGSALMLASSSGAVAKGVLLLFAYSLGMGVPFMLSAMLIDKLGGVFDAIQKHYKVINIVCGIFLILIGAGMMLGLMTYMSELQHIGHNH